MGPSYVAYYMWHMAGPFVEWARCVDGYFSCLVLIKRKTTELNKNMKEEDIVNVISEMCSQAILLPSLGWHFRYHGQVYVYVSGREHDMVRLCIPALAGLGRCDADVLREAVNVSNRNVKFIKAVLREGGCVSLNYDHRLSAGDKADVIVPHMVKALDFAAGYLLEKTGQRLTVSL